MSFFAPLAAAAAELPEWPWLFYRERFDWRWRSFRQVADHLARCATLLAAQPEEVWAYSGRSAVDALMAGWALLAAGKAAVPWWAHEPRPALPYARVDAAKDPEPAPTEGPQRNLLLPPVHSALLPFSAQCLEVIAGGRLRERPDQELGLDDLSALADQVGAALPTRTRASRGVGDRPIFHLGAGLGPRLDHAVLALGLRRHAALALEPYAEATVASILWCRPSHVIATPPEVDNLAAAFDPSAARHSRLEGILVAGAPHAAQLAHWEQRFEVPVHPFPPT